MAFIVPPGGMSGFAQMAPASRAALTPRGVRNGTRKRRASTKSARRASSGKKRNGKRRPKFGSPAWRKMYMKKRR